MIAEAGPVRDLVAKTTVCVCVLSSLALSKTHKQWSDPWVLLSSDLWTAARNPRDPAARSLTYNECDAPVFFSVISTFYPDRNSSLSATPILSNLLTPLLFSLLSPHNNRLFESLALPDWYVE